MVMERCSPDGGGSTMSKINVHTEFNQYDVQFQETVNICTLYITPACPVRHST